ncbi:MAG: hypothetical protein ACPGYV_07330 [Phycisphaeraceae bacterium]
MLTKQVRLTLTLALALSLVALTGCGITRSAGDRFAIDGTIHLPPELAGEKVTATMSYKTPRWHTWNLFRALQNAWGPRRRSGGWLAKEHYTITRTLEAEGAQIRLDRSGELYGDLIWLRIKREDQSYASVALFPGSAPQSGDLFDAKVLKGFKVRVPPPCIVGEGAAGLDVCLVDAEHLDDPLWHPRLPRERMQRR